MAGSLTVVSQTIDKNNPEARLAVQVEARDASVCDSTNRRFRCGVWKVQITALTASAGVQAGDTLRATIQPANYDPLCNDQVIQETIGAGGGTTVALGAEYDHVVAINYGLPGPSAVMEKDGTITLAVIDLELMTTNLELASSIIATATATVTFTEVPAYGGMSSPTARTASLAVSPQNEANWAMLSVDQPGSPSTYFGYAAIQLSSLTSSLTPDSMPSATPTALTITTVPQMYGQLMTVCSYPLPKSQGRSKTFADFFTRVFAINKGKIDGNATGVYQAGRATPIFNLMNCGLTKDASSTDLAVAGLSYAEKVASV
jgi:hypothetical protein